MILPTIVPMSEAEAEAIVEALPGGVAGYGKTWGWDDVIRAVEKHHQRKIRQSLGLEQS